MMKTTTTNTTIKNKKKTKRINDSTFEDIQ